MADSENMYHNGTQWVAGTADSNGNQSVTQGTLLAGEDTTNDVTKVEFQGTYQSVITADTQVKASSGLVYSIEFAPNDAVPTAGTIVVYDNTAESGTEIFRWAVAATAFTPISIPLNRSFGTGLYVGFTTTADVNVTLSYR